jgi:vitamin B12 transporter
MKKKILLSLLASTVLVAQTIELKQIEVTSSQGTTLKKKDVTDNVVIITKEAIEESRVSNLAEALNKLGNIAISQNGGIGQSSSVYLRGMDTKRTLLLMDGVRYNDPTGVGAAANFEQIMLFNVERIEIIKGAQSGVWGADASAGVINIITSEAKKDLHANATVEYGSFDTKKSSLEISYAAEHFDIAVGGLLINTDGFSATEPKKEDANYGKRYDELGLEKDAYENRTLHAKMGFNITGNDRVEFNIRQIESKIDFDAGAGLDSSVENTDLKNRFYTLAYKHKDAINELNIYYNISTFERESEFPSWLGSGTDIYKYKGSVNELKLEDKIEYFQDSFVRFGASYQKFEQEEITADTNKSYNAKSFFITNYNKFDLFASKPTIVTESLRYDDYNNFDDALTGKLGIKQFIKDDFYISTNIGTGFNAPTLGELYGQWGANPNLKPEKSSTLDITLGNDIFWISGFYNEVTDMIEYDMNTWAYIQTSGTSKFKGIELGYKDLFIDKIGLNIMYTYLKTKNADNETIARRPKHQIDTKVIYYINENVNISMDAEYIGERYDAHDQKGAQTGKYIIANAATNIKANKYLTFYAKVDNITDKYYQVVDGYATAGRSLYIGLNAKY